MTRRQTEPQADPGDFAKLAAQRSSGLAREFFDFMRTYKKWWLTPIILMMALVGLLVIAGGTAAAPFIYALF